MGTNIQNNRTEINRRFPKKEKHFEALIIVAFTLVALVIGVIIAINNFSPTIPSVDTDVPFMPHEPVTDTDDQGNKIQVDDGKYVRKDGVYNFMLVGYDRVAGLTDVNMIAQFDTNTGAISIVQIPRDTYARYNQTGGYYRKMNGALSYFKWELADLAAFLEENLCIKIDYYASIDLDAFVNIVDIIGGVEIDVPADLKYEDPDQNLYINIKKGYQTLNGKQAEGFVRFRHDYVQADIGRTNAQKIFMTAFIKKFKNSMDVSTIAKVGAQMIKYADTNLGFNDYVFFATKVLSIDLNNINMMTLPGNSVREYETRGTWYYVLSRSGMLDVVNKYLNVYTKDITPAIFDDDKMFTNPDVEFMEKIYNSDGDVVVYSGDTVDSSGIYIPMVKPKPSKPETTVPDTEELSPDVESESEGLGSDTEAPSIEHQDTEPIPPSDISNPDETLSPDEI